MTVCAAALLAGCGTSGSSTRSEHNPHFTEPDQALVELSDDGPERFAMVTPNLYRGGQPDSHDLELLRALGVTTVIDLRRERLGVRRAESAAARRLGMHFIEYPYFGVLGADFQFIDGVVHEMSAPDGGAVYIHCADGGDRTSLMVALYRVLAQGWDPADAWGQEVVDYGHHQGPVFREIELTYREAVHEHELTALAEQRSVTSRRILAATGDPTLAPAGDRKRESRVVQVESVEVPTRELAAPSLDTQPRPSFAHQEPRADDPHSESGPLLGHSTP